MLAFFLAALESDEDRECFAELYKQNLSQMEQTAMRILKNQHDAEDAVQNAFLQIIRHFEKVYTIPCDRWPFWCICIVRNESLYILRKNSRTISLEDWDGFVENSDDELNYNDIVTLFAQMPETYRSVLEMKLVVGYSGKEIAQRLGITETAVNTRFARGRNLLRKIMERKGYQL